HGVELWKTDGTGAGTSRVADIYAGTTSSSPFNLLASAGDLYFTADDGINGREVWRIDQATSTLARVTSLVFSADVMSAFPSGGVIFSTAGGELYRFDGTNLLPLKTSGFSIKLNLLGAANGLVYFVGGTSATGSELWLSD